MANGQGEYPSYDVAVLNGKIEAIPAQANGRLTRLKQRLRRLFCFVKQVPEYSATPEDTTSSEDTTSPEDTKSSEDTTCPEDAASPEEMTSLEDSTSPEDTTSLEDSTSLEDTESSEDTTIQTPAESQDDEWEQAEDGDKSSMAEPAAPPRLGNLPSELIIEIMRQLPGQDIWSLRQCLQIFLHLFALKPFRKFQGPPRLKDRHPPFSTEEWTAKEKKRAGILLRQDKASRGTCCDPCLKVFSCDGRDSRVADLYDTRFCEGCKERHPVLLFPADSVKQFDQGMGKLYCVGWLGKITLCPHASHETLTWQTIQQRSRREKGTRVLISCTDPSHGSKWATQASACPKLLIYYGFGVRKDVHMKIGWHILLLELDAKSPLCLEAIREMLAGVLDGALQSHRPCKHMLGGTQLRGFAHWGICECFSEPGSTRFPEGPSDLHVDNGARSSWPQTCSCNGAQVLKCTASGCNARYEWHLEAGRVTLSYENEVKAERPSSPTWLDLLDDSPDKGGVFGESSRHVLWCDTPGCATAKESRWEDMVEEWNRNRRRLFDLGSSYSRYQRSWETINSEDEVDSDLLQRYCIDWLR